MAKLPGALLCNLVNEYRLEAQDWLPCDYDSRNAVIVNVLLSIEGAC